MAKFEIGRRVRLITHKMEDRPESIVGTVASKRAGPFDYRVEFDGYDEPGDGTPVLEDEIEEAE